MQLKHRKMEPGGPAEPQAIESDDELRDEDIETIGGAKNANNGEGWTI